MTDEYAGSCHCGAVEYRVEVDLEAEEVLDCNCSMCRRKGFLHVIVPPEQFTLISGAEKLREYRFNTETAVHRFCETCGIHPFYRPRSHPDKVSVNARCLEDVDLDRLAIVPFDGQNWEEQIEQLRGD